MLKKYFSFLFIVSYALIGISQNETFLTNEEKAYLYHIVKKSPTLNRNLDYLFTYDGPINEKDPSDYLYIEEQIIKEPIYLKIQFDEFQNQSSGVIAELASKMALWILYNELKTGLNATSEQNYPPVFKGFIDSLIVRCPDKIVSLDRKANPILPKQYYPILNPNLTYNDRKDLISKLTDINKNEEKQLMDGIHETIKLYTEKKSKDVYRMLGLTTKIESNFLLAAGDGSGTSGLLGEIEKENVDEKGVAKGVGLFTYKTDIITEGKKQVLAPQKEPLEIIHTLGGNTKTNLHVSLWGFNYSTQTTVAITKGEKTYLLYGSKYTGELSPDPAFNNNEKNYKNHLIKLQNEEIPDWEKEVFGEEGLEKKLQQLQVNRKELILAIEKNEYKESMYRMEQKKNKSKIKSIGNKLDYQHKKLSELDKRILEATEEFEAGKLKLDFMKFRLTDMKKNLGEFEQDYKAINHIYYEFEDGTRFNIKTQDLIFAPTSEPEQIEVRLLAVGANPMSSFADEVQLTVATTEVNAKEVVIQNISFDLVDGFKSDGFTLNELSFTPEAEYLLTKITQYSLDYNLPIRLDLKGNGIGEIIGGEIKQVTDQKKATINKYPGETKEEEMENKNAVLFKDLRITTGTISLSNKEVFIGLTSYTDPVQSSIFKTNSFLNNFSKQHPNLTANEVLSGLRTYAVLNQIINKTIAITEEHFKKDKEKKEKYTKYLTSVLEENAVIIRDFRLEYNVYDKSKKQ